MNENIFDYISRKEKENLEKGVEQGMEKGIEQGAREKSISIASKLAAEGISKEVIASTCGLNASEVEKLIG